MKNMLLLFVLVALGATSAYPQENETLIESRLREATLFLQGAQHTRTGNATVGEGITRLVFSSLPAHIDPASLQVSANGNFSVLSATFRNNYLLEGEQDQQYRMLQDSLELLTRQVVMNKALQKALQEEQEMLLANKSIAGSETGVKVEELRAVADFLRERLADISRRNITLEQQVKADQQRIERLRRQLGQLEDLKNRPVGQVVVQVSAEAATRGGFTLSYLVNQAGWRPVYDIRVPEDDQPVEIVLKASAWQNTGHDWNDVMLTFSTGDPRQHGQKPELQPWRLDFLPEYRTEKNIPVTRQSMELQEVIVVEDMVEMDAERSYSFTETTEGRTTREFIVSKPYNLKTGGEEQVVELKADQVPAQYEYYVVPRVTTDAFLVALIADPRQYDLMEAEASLFFGSTFMGQTLINPLQTGDTLELSLGRDPSVLVERERMTDFSRKSFFGNRITETIGWEISLRNNKKGEVTINLQEQVPVSVNQDLDVEVEEMSGAIYDAQRGFLTWRLQLQPGETQKRSFRYSVKYPKDKNVILE